MRQGRKRQGMHPLRFRLATASARSLAVQLVALGDRKSMVSSVALLGSVSGELRRLPGFDKKRHRVPDRSCGATLAFLGKICEAELTAEAESLFQSVRAAFGYKRRELSLVRALGEARLEARDFALELRYLLDPEDASRYVQQTLVVDAASRDLLESDAFCQALGPRFDSLRFELKQRLPVESVVDGAEEAEGPELQVDYPSDCSWCELRFQEWDGILRCDDAAVELRCSRPGSSRELLEAYDALREGPLAQAGLAAALPLA